MDLLNMYMSDDDDDNAPIQRGPKVFRPRITFEVPNDFQFKEKFRLRRGEVDTVLGRIAPYLLHSEKKHGIDTNATTTCGVAFSW